MVMNSDQFDADLRRALAEIGAMLTAKNRSYGNSALNPVRLFARSDAVEQIKVRIDDKISRLVRGRQMATEDTEDDLLGYLVLLKIAKQRVASSE